VGGHGIHKFRCSQGLAQIACQRSRAFADGVFADREQLEWLANDVSDAGGEATIWISELADAAQERELAGRMRASVAAEYRALIEDGRPVTRGDIRRDVERLFRTNYERVIS